MNRYKINNKVIPENQIIGYLHNREIIDMNKLYEDKTQENKLWYDDGNDWVYRPTYKRKNIPKILKYFDVKDVEVIYE